MKSDMSADSAWVLEREVHEYKLMVPLVCFLFPESILQPRLYTIH
jgi:hypothetical protein